jgi:hypothetical protein
MVRPELSAAFIWRADPSPTKTSVPLAAGFKTFQLSPAAPTGTDPAVSRTHPRRNAKVRVMATSVWQTMFASARVVLIFRFEPPQRWRRRVFDLKLMRPRMPKLRLGSVARPQRLGTTIERSDPGRG